MDSKREKNKKKISSPPLSHSSPNILLRLTMQTTLASTDQGIDAEHNDHLKRVLVEMRTSFSVAMSLYNAMKNLESLEDGSEDDSEDQLE